MMFGCEFFDKSGVFKLHCIILYLASLLVGLVAVPSTFNCNFDNNWCQWSNSDRNEAVDDFNWKRGFGNDGKQRGSGASDDHGGGGGYLYIKSKSRGNRTAKLFSPRFTLREPGCFQFWYFMKGRTLGHLAILLANSRQEAATDGKMLWNLRGHQGNQWKIAKVPLPVGTKGVLVIEAFDWRKGRSGNILIDDTAMMTQRSLCRTVQPPYAAPPTSTATPSSNYSATTTSPTTTRQHISSLSTTMSLGNISTAASSNSVSVTHNSAFSTRSQSATMISATEWSSTVKLTSATMVTAVSTNLATSSKTDNLNQTYTKAANSTRPPGASTGLIIAIVLCVVFVSIGLSVALWIYSRRRKKQQSAFSDNCSVVMTRMYPELAMEAPSTDYRKFT